MALADIFLTMYMPRMIALTYVGYEWQVDNLLGEITCRISTLLNYAWMTASILTVVAISFDRFLAVVFPLRPSLLTIPRTKGIIFFIWLSAIAFRAPMAYSASLNSLNGKPHCYIALHETFGDETKKIYYFLNLFSFFLIPFLFILILYTAILITLKKRKPPQVDTTLRINPWQQHKEETTKKVLQLAIAVVIAFVLCWLLYFIRLILYSYNVDVSCNVLFVHLFLAHSNSAFNPCLYVVFSESYRHGVKNIISQFIPQCYWTKSYVLPSSTSVANSKAIYEEPTDGELPHQPNCKGESARIPEIAIDYSTICD
ncbi:neuropeptide FF receptor 2-like [Stylophora pistillata]|uniref:neuropeptide FF receptor 2-like n=1 Tax=Stylophora pistillata TaxID=50429 RepID=UPI000C04CD15|nr:neuropeptide FF receptor 2-like [Stylophora pistillata]